MSILTFLCRALIRIFNKYCVYNGLYLSLNTLQVYSQDRNDKKSQIKKKIPALVNYNKKHIYFNAWSGRTLFCRAPQIMDRQRRNARVPGRYHQETVTRAAQLNAEDVEEEGEDVLEEEEDAKERRQTSEKWLLLQRKYPRFLPVNCLHREDLPIMSDGVSLSESTISKKLLMELMPGL